MSNVIYIREMPQGPNEPKLRQYKVTFDGYRQAVSLNAFFGTRKLQKDRKRGVLWVSHTEASRKIDMDVAKEMGHTTSWDTLPTHEHESIWEFYKAIGYDYKTKKWYDPLMTVAHYIELLQAMPQDVLIMRMEVRDYGDPFHGLKKPKLVDITEHGLHGDERYWFEAGEFYDDPDGPLDQQTVVRV